MVLAQLEIGTALGIAIMGSMFTSGYRRALEGDLDGLPACVAERAREAPGLAFDAARGLDPGGDALAAAASDAFTSGMRFSMLVGAGLLVAAAAFVWLRGPSRTQEVVEDAIDEGDPGARLAALDGGVTDEPRPGPVGDLAPAPASPG